ncbi:MAG TPA: hypothetical protein VH374_01060 [Polyangia bacterium]|nr:hypothetical protein [Polyangia bacterium]
MKSVMVWFLFLVVTVGGSAWAAPPESPAATITVLPFDNATGKAKYAPLSVGLADMVFNDLASSTGLQVVGKVRAAANPPTGVKEPAGLFDQAAAKAAGQAAGAAYVVVAAIRSVAPAVRIDVRAVRVADATVVCAATASGRADHFVEAQDALVAKVVDVLAGVLGPGDGERIKQGAHANHPTTLAAALEYGAGLQARDGNDFESAAAHLKKAIDGQPAFALGHSRTSDVVRALYRIKRPAPEPPPQSPRKTKTVVRP